MSYQPRPAHCDLTLIQEGSHFVPALPSATCDFALKLYRKLASSDGNVFFSPFSISVAMAMLLRGTQEKSADEIKQLLGYDKENLSMEDLHNCFEWYFTIFGEKKDCYALEVANALALQHNFHVLPEYKNDLEKIYNATTWELDFMNDGDKALTHINEWVKSKTRDMVPKLLDRIEPLTVTILLNAIYFKGLWEHQFNPKKTRRKEFFNRGTDKITVLMMHANEKFPFVETKDYKAVELPYKGHDIFMLILLPRERSGLELLEKNLDKKFLKSVRHKLQTTKITIALPKFRMEYSKNMNEVFRELGVTTIFNFHQANFRGLSNSYGLEVSKVIHKAVVDVNEEGTEAAAATSVAIVQRCKRVTPEFVADHPFLFLLYDKRSEILLFMGRVFEL